MSMIHVTDRFKGDLLAMLGMSSAEAVHGLAPPRTVSGLDGSHLLVWDEMVENTEDNRRYPIRLMARVSRDRIVAVGIHARDFIFVLDEGAKGKPFFAAVPKNGEFGPEELNWIQKDKDRFLNAGAI